MQGLSSALVKLRSVGPGLCCTPSVKNCVLCLGGEPMPIGSYVKVRALPGTAMVEEGRYVWKIKDYATHQVISTKRPCGQAHLRFSESQSFPFCGGIGHKTKQNCPPPFPFAVG